MTLIKVDFENGKGKGWFFVNLDKVIYITWHEPSVETNRGGYAEVFFTEGRPAIVLNEEQYKQLLKGNK